MRMPEPEEDKVTATGGGLRASGSGGDHKSRNSRVTASRRQPPQTPPPHLKDASPSQQLFTNSNFQTTLTTHSGLHLAHTFVLQSVWSTLHVSLREATLRMCMSSNTNEAAGSLLKGKERKANSFSC